MAILVILVLAIMWAAVLLPPILRSRAEGASSVGGVSDFFSRLREGLGRGRLADPTLPPLQPLMGPMSSGAIGGVPVNDAPMTPIGPVRVPGAMTPAQRRRRDVLVLLLGFAGIMFLMAIMSGSTIVWILQLLADLMIVAYVYLLLQLKARNAAIRPQQQPQRPLVAPVIPSLPNVHDLTARRFPPAMTTGSVDAHRGAKVLALRRSATSW